MAADKLNQLVALIDGTSYPITLHIASTLLDVDTEDAKNIMEQALEQNESTLEVLFACTIQEQGRTKFITANKQELETLFESKSLLHAQIHSLTRSDNNNSTASFQEEVALSKSNKHPKIAIEFTPIERKICMSNSHNSLSCEHLLPNSVGKSTIHSSATKSAATTKNLFETVETKKEEKKLVIVPIKSEDLSSPSPVPSPIETAPTSKPPTIKTLFETIPAIKTEHVPSATPPSEDSSQPTEAKPKSAAGGLKKFFSTSTTSTISSSFARQATKAPIYVKEEKEAETNKSKEKEGEGERKEQKTKTKGVTAVKGIKKELPSVEKPDVREFVEDHSSSSDSEGSEAESEKDRIAHDNNIRRSLQNQKRLLDESSDEECALIPSKKQFSTDILPSEMERRKKMQSLLANFSGMGDEDEVEKRLEGRSIVMDDMQEEVHGEEGNSEEEGEEEVEGGLFDDDEESSPKEKSDEETKEDEKNVEEEESKGMKRGRKERDFGEESESENKENKKKGAPKELTRKQRMDKKMKELVGDIPKGKNASTGVTKSLTHYFSTARIHAEKPKVEKPVETQRVEPMEDQYDEDGYLKVVRGA